MSDIECGASRVGSGGACNAPEGPARAELEYTVDMIDLHADWSIQTGCGESDVKIGNLN
jgi:hypothetical protein